MQSQYISTLNNKIDIRQDNPEEIYKRPIPLDMINKFVSLDSFNMMTLCKSKPSIKAIRTFGLLLTSISSTMMIFLRILIPVLICMIRV